MQTKAAVQEFSNNEREFIFSALKEHSLRIDGRSLWDVRKLKILFGHQDGHAEVQLGTTRVIAHVSCEIVAPYLDRPTEGFYNFNIDFSPMADSSLEMGRGFIVEVGRVVERGLRESRAIDTEALCIVSGEKVWSIRCDVNIVDNGGNLIDCTSIAIITALLHFRKPSTTILGKNVIVHSHEEKEAVSLSIHHIPICITFGFFEEGNVILVDPSLKEELVMSGRMTMTLNSLREVCAVQKAGGTPISVDQVVQCATIAAVKVQEITEVIQTALKENKEAQRQKLVSIVERENSGTRKILSFSEEQNEFQEIAT